MWAWHTKPTKVLSSSSRAPWSVVCRNTHGWRKPSLVGSFVLPPENLGINLKPTKVMPNKGKKICPHCDPYGEGIEHLGDRLDGFMSLSNKFLFPLNIIIDRNVSFFSVISKFFLNSIFNILLVIRILREVDVADDDPNMHSKSMVIIKEAHLRKIPIKIIKVFGRYTNFFSIITKGSKKFFQGAPFYELGKILEIDCDDKYKLKEILKRNNFPHAEGKSFNKAQNAILYAEKMGFPLVIKPRASSLSKHITCNIKSKNELEEAIRIVKIISPEFIVERHIEGDIYRITLVKHHFVACCLREAPNVMGDGIHTVQELIEMKNADPKRGESHQKNFALHKIYSTPLTGKLLSEQKLKFSSKLKKGQKVYLHNKVILACGADIHDRTDRMHQENIALFERVSQLCKLPLIGFDFLCQDISRPYYAQKCAIIEANSLPSIEMHHFPTSGDSQNIAKHIFDHYTA